jgi:septum formation protein
LSGTTHSAVTGIAIIYRDEKSKEIKKIVDSMETRVEFFELDDDTIKTYISSKEPINRAGGYAIQGKGAMLVKRIEGSYSNVVGLPLELLISMLKKYTGKGILDFNEVSNWSFPNTIS